MCLIIRTEKDKLISKELMMDWSTKNNDGWGFMWVENNHIKTLKGLGLDKNGLYMMNNGVVSQEIRDEDKSDTWHLVEDYLKPLFRQAKNPHTMIRDEKF